MSYSLVGLRAVVAARVSHVQGPEKTSHHSQKDRGIAYAAGQEWEVVGTVEDLDVSAIKLSPWQRPDLRQWLTDRKDQFDALIFSKTDRVFRRADDSLALTKWAKEHRKILVLIDDGIRIDFYTPEDQQDPMAAMNARVFLFMASFFAELEGQRFVQRAHDRIGKLRATDRWGYGVPPFGFMVVEHPSGQGGKALAHDPEAQAVLHRTADRLFAGDSLTRMTYELSSNPETPSPRDWLRIRSGKPTRGEAWSTQRLKAILTSPATQGVKMILGRPLLDAEGVPVTVGPPSFDPDTWARIQNEVEQRCQGPHERRHSLNPVLGVGVCGNCESNLAQSTKTTRKGVEHRYFRCSKKPACPLVSVVADEAEHELEQAFLDIYSTRKIVERVWRAGSDHSHELEQAEQTIASLREDRELGLYTTPDDEKRYRSQMLALIKRRDLLAELPVVKSGWVQVETEKTYGEIWPAATMEERRQMLIDANVKLVVNGPKDYRVVSNLIESFI
ncbi:recombinase family protein [Nocardia sp. NPDC057440]|uniref:recombinase family protein n=1 Tax=Nocardia sp. NPDC057440 TaxID=3346134 RepID=UPI00366D6207